MPQIKGKQIADAQITQEKLNLVDPTSALEAATKQYVDNLADGKIDGTIAANEVAFGTGADSIGGDANFTWDAGTDTLALTSAGPALTVSNDVDGQFVSIEAGSHSMDFIDPLGSSSVALISAVNGFTAGDGGTNSTNMTAGQVLVQQPGMNLSSSVTPASVTLTDNVQQIGLSASAAELSIKGDSGLPTTPTIAAKDFDNSATTLNLSIGGLTVNGAAGNAGQVLQSQGAGSAPVWADAASTGPWQEAAGIVSLATPANQIVVGGDATSPASPLIVKDQTGSDVVEVEPDLSTLTINEVGGAGGKITLAAQAAPSIVLDEVGGAQTGIYPGTVALTGYTGMGSYIQATDNGGTAGAGALHLLTGEIHVGGGAGSAGEILTSNGAGLAPTWSALSVPNASITQAKLSLTTPSSPNDASTKQYVDDLVNGTAWKTAAFAVEATASVDVVIGGVRYVDGVYCGVGTRVLLTAQSVPSQNGIWVIQAGSYTRPDDFADGSSAVNAALFVSDGDNYADTQWVCTSSPAVVGTNNLSFIQFGASVSYTAGDGLALLGNAFSVSSGGITETMLADTSVTQAKLSLIDPTSALEAATKQYVDNSIGDIALPQSGQLSRVYYVSKGGNDGTADGSISKPFLTLQAAHDQALLDYPLSGISTAEVQISVAPGTYIGNLSVTRQNTYFVAQPQSAESKSVVIQGTVSIDCSTALYVYAEKVSFSGFLFSPVANTVACVLITGTGIFSSLFDNCYINSSSTNAAAHAIHCNNTAATRPIIRLTRCVIRAERNANNAIKGERGDWRVVMSSVENQAVPSVSTTSAAVFENDATLTAGYALFESANNAAVISCSGTMPGSTKASIAWSTVVNTCNVSASHGFSLATAGLAALISYSTFSVTNTLSTTFTVTGVASSVIALPYCSYVVNTNVGGGFTLSPVSQDFAGGDLTGRFPVPTIRSLSVTTAKIAALAVDSTKLASNAVTTAKIADAQVTQAKLSLTSPSNAADAATKQYVDNLTLGLSWKDVVRLVATSPVTLSGVQTIDGLSTGDRDRVLLTAQADAKDNGIYLTSPTTNWARADDLAVGTSAQGTACLVAQGGAYADTQWICTTDAPNDIVAANSLSFTQFGVGTSYTAGNGLQLLGSAFSVLAETDSIAVSSSGIKAATLSPVTLDQNPSFATVNDNAPTGIVLGTNPRGSGVVHVLVNGLRASVGLTKECYFSNDGGVTSVAYANLATGDALYWNGIVAGYDLDTTDEITFVYQDIL